MHPRFNIKTLVLISAGNLGNGHPLQQVKGERLPKLPGKTMWQELPVRYTCAVPSNLGSRHVCPQQTLA